MRITIRFSLSSYNFKKNDLEIQTFITQEMLKKGFLASTNFYASTAHTIDHLNSYFDALNDVYHNISMCELCKQDVKDLLNGPVCHSGFKRLN